MGAASRPEPVRYWRGNSATHPSTFMSGRLLFDEDTGNVYLQYRDLSTGEAITRQLTDDRKFNTSGGQFTGPVVLALQPEEVEQYIDDQSMSWPKELIPITKKYADAIKQKSEEHIANTDIHITPQERKDWNNKVDKREGYDLSKNDFTDELKRKLEGISEEANKTLYQQIQTTGIRIGIITIDNNTYDIFVPEVHDIDGNAETATQLKTSRSINGVVFNGTENITNFGSCKKSEDPDDAQKWVLNVNDFDNNLPVGSIIVIRFEEDNLAENPTLKINDTPEAPILFEGQPIDADAIRENSLFCFVYDGANYNVLSSPAGALSKEAQATIDALSDSLALIKEKLDTVETGANNYSLPPAIKYTPGGDNPLGGVVIGDGIAVDALGQIYISRKTILDLLGVPEGETIVTTGALDPDKISGLIRAFSGAVDTVYEQTDDDSEESKIITQGHDGTSGLVPTPVDGNEHYVLCGNGSWQSVRTLIQDGGVELDEDEPISIEKIEEICV